MEIEEEESMLLRAIFEAKGKYAPADPSLISSPAQAPRGYRPLSVHEVEALRNEGCISEDWSIIYLKDGASLASNRIIRCYFYGKILLGGALDGFVHVEDLHHLRHPQGLYDSTFINCWIGPSVEDLHHLRHPQGLYDSTFINCWIGPSVLVKGNQLISHIAINEGAILLGNGTIACKDRTTFSSGMEIRVGSEVLGRPLALHPEIRMEDILPQAQLTQYPNFDREVYLQRLKGLVDGTVSKIGIIGRGSRIKGCPRIINTFVGPGAVIEGSDIEECTILSSEDEPTTITSNCLVHRSLLQYGVHVSGHALVKDSLLMEHSHVDQEAKLNHVVACPDSGIATGECHHSLVGPFVGFHHQSLLIAALWPKGRGNVAYGAKIGSNHTGRLADQEAILGEGIFFGLGALAKLPINLSESPYSIVAANTSLDQQRLHFPFSLISSCREPNLMPAGLNQLRPAWVLKHSPYTIFRNENKFSKRSKARRHDTTWRIFRPETVDFMIEAREKLQRAISEPADYYTKRHVPGLGANILSFRNAEEGIHAYTQWIKRYALLGLVARLSPSPFPSSSRDASIYWEHQAKVLLMELDHSQSLSTPLQELLVLETGIIQAVESSKGRDDLRGSAIIDDYQGTHPPASQDPIVKQAKLGLENLASKVDRLVQESPLATLSLSEALASLSMAVTLVSLSSSLEISLVGS